MSRATGKNSIGGTYPALVLPIDGIEDWEEIPETPDELIVTDVRSLQMQFLLPLITSSDCEVPEKLHLGSVSHFLVVSFVVFCFDSFS